MAADSEISLLTRGPTLSKATRKTWSSQLAEEEEDGGEQPRVKFSPPEGGIPSPQLRCFESESSSLHEVAAERRPSDATQAQLNLSFDTSQVSVRSTDTTLEYYDAPLSEEQEAVEGHTATVKDEEEVTVNVKGLTEKEEAEEALLASEDLERNEEGVKDDEIFEEVMETSLEQEAKKEQDVESSGEQEDAAILDQEETSSHNQCNSCAAFALFISFRNVW